MPLPSPVWSWHGVQIDVEALLAAIEIRRRRSRTAAPSTAAPSTLPVKKRFVVVAACRARPCPRPAGAHSSRRRTDVLGRQRPVPRRVVHVLPAARRRRASAASTRRASHASQLAQALLRLDVIDFSRLQVPAGTRASCSRSNFGSSASMARKNPSWLACSREPLHVEHRVIRHRQPVQREHRRSPRVSAANRIVTSNVTGMNDGQLLSGRPPMFSG